jgi:hypothetical protein
VRSADGSAAELEAQLEGLFHDLALDLLGVGEELGGVGAHGGPVTARLQDGFEIVEEHADDASWSATAARSPIGPLGRG